MKYYTMKECFDACGDEDFPYIDGQFNIDKNITKNMIVTDIGPTFHWEDIHSDKWQIKRAEPKVLSIDDIVEDTAKIGAIRHFETITHPKEALQICAKKADKNGQLREWQRPEQVELREACQDLSDKRGKPRCITDEVTRICEAVKNLKPPYENDL